MKIGDKVDVLETMCEHYSSPKVIWSAGWTLELISGDWALVMKELHNFEHIPCQKRIVRQKVEKDFLRLSSVIPDKGLSTREKLPLPGSSVMFKVPNSHLHNNWALGLVVRQNKKSIKVLHNNKLINRNFAQFIEVTNGEH